MKPVCFIAARGGSRGVPNKNIRIIGGKPLIAHTIEKAIKSNIFSHVIVSTDSKKIAKICKKSGVDYLASVWDEEMLEWIDKYLKYYKIGF